MKSVTIIKSSRSDKKYMAMFNIDGKKKTTHFGQAGADDYTITKDEEQKKRYRTRHKRDLETNDPTRAGYLSYYILWNKPTITESIADYKKKFNFN
jgi:hypothetical protein